MHTINRGNSCYLRGTEFKFTLVTGVALGSASSSRVREGRAQKLWLEVVEEDFFSAQNTSVTRWQIGVPKIPSDFLPQ